jgi:hypothetical protein
MRGLEEISLLPNLPNNTFFVAMTFTENCLPDLALSYLFTRWAANMIAMPGKLYNPMGTGAFSSTVLKQA